MHYAFRYLNIMLLMMKQYRYAFLHHSPDEHLLSQSVSTERNWIQPECDITDCSRRSSYGQVQFGISMTTRGKTTGKVNDCLF